MVCNIIYKLVNRVGLEVCLQVIGGIVDNSLDRALLKHTSLLYVDMSLDVDLFSTNWSLNKVICRQLDVSEHFSLNFE